MPKLLIIDDEPSIRLSIKAVFEREDISVFGAENAEEGIRVAADHAPDVILLDIRLGKSSGLELFLELRRIDPRCIIIFITGHGTTETAIEAMKLGAFDYLSKPLDAKQLKQVVEQAFAISRLVHVPAIIDEGERPEDKPDRLIGSGPAMQTVCKQIGRVAPQNVNVLILGESGTGKELVARALYQHSHRSQTPFLAINCAAIPESLLESELFGYEKGAFTGAVRRRVGKFEQCHGGTIFLDEVGDMALHTQAKILRLLQDGCFERLGGNESISVDVRIIAATNQNIESLIEREQFRKDLYYRLCGVTIALPPLRDHSEDIAELAHYYLFRYNHQQCTSVQSISPEALELMKSYPWPGNVRELQNVIRQALIASAGPTLLTDFLPDELQQQPPEIEDHFDISSISDPDWQILPQTFKTWIADGETEIYPRLREQFDKLILSGTLQHVGGNRNQAAKILGLSLVTLRAKLRSMGLAEGKNSTPPKGSADE